MKTRLRRISWPKACLLAAGREEAAAAVPCPAKAQALKPNDTGWMDVGACHQDLM